MIPTLRPIREDDFAKLNTFTKEVGFGVTTLAKDPDFLKEKISHSLLSFEAELTQPFFESYLFVLEVEPHQVVGISAILSRIGINEPFYAYHLLHEHQHSPSLKLDRDVPLLHFIKARKNPTEIGTLFLESEYRHKGLGKLLSFSRFLFMATFKERFAQNVVAEMRGFSVEGVSPFYNAVGKHFLQRTFDEANLLRIKHPESIGEIFPRHPLYPWLLPKKAAEAIGRVHPEAEPALTLLKEQGFRISHYRDFLDGGPHVYAPLHEIQAIKESFIVSAEIGEIKMAHKALFANTSLDFRACLGEFQRSGEKIIIAKEIANALKVENGEEIRVLKL